MILKLLSYVLNIIIILRTEFIITPAFINHYYLLFFLRWGIFRYILNVHFYLYYCIALLLNTTTIFDYYYSTRVHENGVDVKWNTTSFFLIISNVVFKKYYKNDFERRYCTKNVFRYKRAGKCCFYRKLDTVVFFGTQL